MSLRRRSATRTSKCSVITRFWASSPECTATTSCPARESAIFSARQMEGSSSTTSTRIRSPLYISVSTSRGGSWSAVAVNEQPRTSSRPGSCGIQVIRQHADKLLCIDRGAYPHRRLSDQLHHASPQLLLRVAQLLRYIQERMTRLPHV